jgi:hypothetical protein
MFGLEILDIVIGLTFIYLLLSLMATAIHEYLAAMRNKRGKELAKGIARLLDDIDGSDALNRAMAAVKARVEIDAETITERFYSHRLIRPLATRRGWIMRLISGDQPRLPSYIPARTFAMAFLDIMGYKKADAAEPVTHGPPAHHDDPDSVAASVQRRQLIHVMELLKRESALDVTEHAKDLRTLLESATIDAGVKGKLLEALAAGENRLQKLHDSVEVWFNNSMDRVSGAYKRHTQGALFCIGLVVAAVLNADTIQMWRILATNDEIRTAMAERAAANLPALERWVYRDTAAQAGPPATPSAPAATPSEGTARTTGTTNAAAAPGAAAATDPAAPSQSPSAAAPADTTVRADSIAREKYLAIRAQLDSMELKLGWTWEEAARLGLAARDTTTRKAIPGLKPTDVQGWKLLAKLIGLLMTALAISMGAPFWFDTLNKVISIRAAGRSPAERPKSPEGPAKRAAEQPHK